MGTTYLTDGDDLTRVANAIRAKSGGSSQLAFPSGFVSEIGNIPSGGGGLTLLASGSYTQVSGIDLTIPVTFTGTPKLFVVCVDEELENVGQSLAAAMWVGDLNNDYASFFPDGFVETKVKTANNTYGYYYINPGGSTAYINSTQIKLYRTSNNYPWKPNDYNWYIYG